MQSLDLHGIKHEDVDRLVENYFTVQPASGYNDQEMERIPLERDEHSTNMATPVINNI